MLNISNKIYKEIKNHARKIYPQECCGLLVQINNKLITYVCQNIAKDKINNFTVYPLDYLKADKLGEIVAFYHSHCLEEHLNDFSILDKLNSSINKLPIILYYVPEDTFKIYNDSTFPFLKYIGLPFEYNNNDCLGLVEKFYLNEFNIRLPHIFRDKDWFSLKPRIIEENIDFFGFTNIVDLNEEEIPKYGDIILIKTALKKSSNHMMIYIGQNQVLHQKFLSYSAIDLYNDTLKEQTTFILRHENNQ